MVPHPRRRAISNNTAYGRRVSGASGAWCTYTYVLSGHTEVIPPDDADFPVTDPVERLCFVPYFGKKFGSIMEGLRPTLRNALAHLDPERAVLIADSYADTAKCYEAVPVLKFIAREMLDHEIATQMDELATAPSRGEDRGDTHGAPVPSEQHGGSPEVSEEANGGT